MSLLDKLTNKIQYSVAKQLDDPAAAQYAKQQEAQAIQDAASQKREEQQEKDKAEAAAKKAAADAKAAELVRRSEFKTDRIVGNSASQILKIFGSLLLTIVMLYGGHLAANEAIGYRNPFRIVSFLYGALFFFYVIPKSLFDAFYLKKVQHFYTFLPLSTYVPVGNLESLFLTPFCYVEDSYSGEARKAVEILYAKGFSESMKTAVAVTNVVGATVGLAVAAKNSKVSKVEAPKVEVPEPPKVEVPEPPKAPEVLETPNAEAPKAADAAEPPKVADAAEPPKVEPPKVEPPKVEAPKAAEPPKAADAAEPPKVEPPKVEPPKVEPPKAADAVEPPKVEPPKAPEVVETPKV